MFGRAQTMVETLARCGGGCRGERVSALIKEEGRYMLASSSSASSFDMLSSSLSTGEVSGRCPPLSSSLHHNSCAALFMPSSIFKHSNLLPQTRSQIVMYDRSRDFSTKTTTNIVGLEVLKNPREKLISVYSSILKEITAVPEDAQYRKNVERMTRDRLAVVVDTEDVEVIEEKIGFGQVEELHEQAVRELNLIPKMIEWRAWELPEGKEIEVTIKEAPKTEESN